MRYGKWRWRLEIKILVLALAMLLGLSFAAAAVLAEGALHPLLRRRASDTAAFAQSVASASSGTARKVTLRARDGTLLDAWWLLPSQSNGQAVMVCHGVADSAYGALGFALLFLRNGYAVLVPESRGHGESRGYVTYGIYESEDTVQWLTWIHHQGFGGVFGFGESLGGAILIQSLAHGADFQALVAECSYDSFESVADDRVARFIPGSVAKILVKEGLLYTRFRYGVDLSQARPDLAIRHAHVPILLVHGLADQETSPDHSRRLAQANPAFTRLWLVEGAGHTGAYAAAPKEFEEKILRWLQVSERPISYERSVTPRFVGKRARYRCCLPPELPATRW